MRYSRTEEVAGGEPRPPGRGFGAPVREQRRRTRRQGQRSRARDPGGHPGRDRLPRGVPGEQSLQRRDATDPTGDALGYPYTHGEETEFAVRRAVERLGFVGREAEELITTWVAGLRSLDRDRWGRWDEVAAEGPPEPTPPWR
jgi:hypothetical protein